MRPAARRSAAAALRRWTQEHFQLAPDAVVSVAEIACGLPGCPPLETVVTFWTDGQTRHSFKIFKSLDEVRAHDLPPGWMKPALVSAGKGEDACC